MKRKERRGTGATETVEKKQDADGTTFVNVTHIARKRGGKRPD
jgi:hypothetical protein